ncbi:MAG: hypothetical protein ABEJ81_04175 [Haloferacaceae archaeon]
MDDDGLVARLLHDDETGLLTTAERDGGDGDPEPDRRGPESDPLEPESVSAEHAAFVLAGAALTLLVILNAL